MADPAGRQVHRAPRRGIGIGRRPVLPISTPMMLPAALVFALGTVWAVSQPPSAAPDEPSHIVKAVSMWSGNPIRAELIVDGQAWYGNVQVPRFFGEGLPGQACVQAVVDSAAEECDLGPDSAGGFVTASTSAAGHPPAYYALVGWIGRLFPSQFGFYAMRIGSVLLSAGLMLVATISVTSATRSLYPAIAALTGFSPVAAFVGGSVNPNAFEVLGTVALAAAGVALLRSTRRGVGFAARLAGLAFLSLCLGLTRPISFVFVTLAVGTVALIGVSHWRDMLRWPTVLALGSASVGILAGLGWQLFSGHLSVEVQPIDLPENFSPTQSLVALLGTAIGQTGGQLNSLEAGPSFGAVSGWIVAALSFLVAAYLLGRRRGWITALAVSAFAIALPAIANAPSVRTYGVIWQGRYALPAYAVALLAAGFAVSDRRLRPLERHQMIRFARLGCVAMATGHLLGYWSAMYRWTVGMGAGMWWPFNEEWQPPLPAVLLLLGMVVTCAAYAVLLPACLAHESPTGEAEGVPTSGPPTAADPDQLTGHRGPLQSATPGEPRGPGADAVRRRLA